MTCGGCSGAVTRALKKAQEKGPGSEHHTLLSLTITHSQPVSSYDVSLEKQEVLVTGTIPYDDVFAVISKTGKEVSIDSVDAPEKPS
jgi:copper chaperone